MDSMGSPDDHYSLRSLSRCDSRNDNEGSRRRKSSISGTKSLGRSSGISFLKDLQHTVETPETHFVRAATGRGSIKRGPAPTKASVLRQQKQTSEMRSKTPNCPLHGNQAPMTPTLRRRAPSPASSISGYGSQRSSISNNDYSFKALVKPSVVRPSR